MKEYNVGDTIYMKGTVEKIDENDYERPYGIKFVDWAYVGPLWPRRSTLFDELPTAEPVKPVLPKAVADELEYAKNHRNCNFYGYLRAASSDATSMDCPATTRFLDCFRDEKIKILSDAWFNGYTVEEKKYNVKVPHTKDVWYYKADKVYLQTICPATDKKLRGKFTETEIEHYGLQDCEKEEVK